MDGEIKIKADLHSYLKGIFKLSLLGTVEYLIGTDIKRLPMLRLLTTDRRHQKLFVCNSFLQEGFADSNSARCNEGAQQDPA